MNSLAPFEVEREYRQRRMSGAGQDLFHTQWFLQLDANKYF